MGMKSNYFSNKVVLISGSSMGIGKAIARELAQQGVKVILNGRDRLMWPNAPEILAKAALDHNIPFVLSTVTTSSIERIAEITEGQAWFQLYHPAEDRLRNDIIKRADSAGCPVLVILCDVPTFG